MYDVKGKLVGNFDGYQAKSEAPGLRNVLYSSVDGSSRTEVLWVAGTCSSCDPEWEMGGGASAFLT